MQAWHGEPHGGPLRSAQAQPRPEPITDRVASRWSMPTGRWSRAASRRRGERLAAEFPCALNRAAMALSYAMQGAEGGESPQIDRSSGRAPGQIGLVPAAAGVDQRVTGTAPSCRTRAQANYDPAFGRPGISAMVRICPG